MRWKEDGEEVESKRLKKKKRKNKHTHQHRPESQEKMEEFLERERCPKNGKVSYDNITEANNGIVDIDFFSRFKLTSNRQKKENRAYKCEWCEKYHLTSS